MTVALSILIAALVAALYIHFAWKDRRCPMFMSDEELLEACAQEGGDNIFCQEYEHRHPDSKNS